jgi:predicted GIY-YIG superfamily endonuclease
MIFIIFNKKMSKTGIIYIIKNKINNLVYIGATTQDLDKRWYEHKSDYNNTKIHTRKIHQAFNEHKLENFYIEELETIKFDDKNELKNKENYYINKFDSFKNGYNSQSEELIVEIKTYKCDKCDKDFSTKSNLNRHITHCKTNIEFKCKECGESFTQNDSLRRHLLNNCRMLEYNDLFKTKIEEYNKIINDLKEENIYLKLEIKLLKEDRKEFIDKILNKS